MRPDMSPTGSVQQTELQGSVTESMIMDPSCDDEWGADLYCTPAPTGKVQSATPTGRKLIQQAYSSSSKFAPTNLQPYPEPIKPGSNEWNSTKPWEVQLYKDVCRRAKSSGIRLVMDVVKRDRAIAEVAWKKVGTVPGHTGLEALILWATQQQQQKLTKLQQQCQQDLQKPPQEPPDDLPAPDTAPANGKPGQNKVRREGSKERGYARFSRPINRTRNAINLTRYADLT